MSAVAIPGPIATALTSADWELDLIFCQGSEDLVEDWTGSSVQLVLWRKLAAQSWRLELDSAEAEGLLPPTPYVPVRIRVPAATMNTLAAGTYAGEVRRIFPGGGVEFVATFSLELDQGQTTPEGDPGGVSNGVTSGETVKLLRQVGALKILRAGGARGLSAKQVAIDGESEGLSPTASDGEFANWLRQPAVDAAEAGIGSISQAVEAVLAEPGGSLPVARDAALDQLEAEGGEQLAALALAAAAILSEPTGSLPVARIAALAAVALAGSAVTLYFDTWAALAARSTAGLVDGQQAKVRSADAGTHTDPVVGGTVNNAGVFCWSASPAGWKRLANLEADDAASFRDLAAAQAVLAAASQVGAAAEAAKGASLRAVMTATAQTMAGRYDLWGGAANLVPIASDMLDGVVLGVDKVTGRLGGSAIALLLKDVVDAQGVWRHNGSGSTLPLIVDRDFGCVLGIDTATGAATGSLIASLTVSGSGDETAALAAADIPIRAQWNGIIGSGESLSVGAKARPVLSTSQPYNNLTFGSGPKASRAGNSFGGLNTSPGTSTSKALVEDVLNTTGTDADGETPSSGMANGLVERGARFGIPTSSVWFASSAGRSGDYLYQLIKGAAQYTQFLNHVTDAKTLATAAGKSYALHFVPLILGVNDASAGTSYATFKSQLTQYATDLDTDGRAATGQTSPVHMLITQAYRGEAVELAQFDAVNEHRLIHFVSPMFFFPWDADHVHQTNVGTRWMAEYLARAASQIMDEHREPDCLWPIACWAVGTFVYLKFRVPTRPIQFDTTTLLPTTDNGMKIVDDTGTLTLSSPLVIDGDTLRYTINRTLGTNPVWRCGLDYVGTGNQYLNVRTHNLRDATPDSRVIDGVARPLFHVAPHFSFPIQKVDI